MSVALPNIAWFWTLPEIPYEPGGRATDVLKIVCDTPLPNGTVTTVDNPSTSLVAAVCIEPSGYLIDFTSKTGTTVTVSLSIVTAVAGVPNTSVADRVIWELIEPKKPPICKITPDWSIKEKLVPKAFVIFTPAKLFIDRKLASFPVANTRPKVGGGPGAPVCPVAPVGPRSPWIP